MYPFSKIRIVFAVSIGGVFLSSVGLAHPAEHSNPPEAFEIGPDNVDQFPKGKEADGIIGDLVLRNGRIEALVSANLPDRKANLKTYYRASTPGCLYDLTVCGSDNDQLTCFGPGDLQGRVSSVSVVDAGSSGAARVVTTRTAATGLGISERHDYSINGDDPYLVVRSTWTNRRKKPVKLRVAPKVTGLRNVIDINGIWVGDAQNPMDRQGYAWTPQEGDFSDVELAPGEGRTVTTLVAPGRSPAEAYSALAKQQGPVGVLKGRVRDVDGRPASTASVDILIETSNSATSNGATANSAANSERDTTATQTLTAYPREDGSFDVSLPTGSYSLLVHDIGRASIKRSVEISAGTTTALDFDMERASRVRFVVTENAPEGRKIPSKVQFLGIGTTKDPDFGVNIQAHGCDHQYHSEKGDFSFAVPPGKYRVVVTRGIEYTEHEDIVTIEPGTEVEVRVVLHRVVDTTGWISTDYHNHSTPSGDNYCGTDDRVINLAAEHIEFAPTTEHNRIYDWAPHIDKLGLSEEVATVIGIELTGPNAHLNAFPLPLTPYTQDNGSPRWVHDPRINAINLRDFGQPGPDRWVHLNHPNVGEFFRDRDADGVADGGYPGLEHLIDSAEVWSTEILNLKNPIERTDSKGKVTRRENRTFAWLQLLNRGRRMWCIAVSDAHSVFGNGVGGWRTYVPSSTDQPAKVDHEELIRHSKAGRMFVTNGPFLEVELSDGTLPGGSTRATGSVDVSIRVQTTTWIDIDRVQILVNGRAPATLNFTRGDKSKYFRGGASRVRFQGTITVPLTSDAHVIVAAVGEGFDLRTGYGRSWQSRMHPCAFTNPIFVDTDGDGFTANGDTLDQPLPVGKH